MKLEHTPCYPRLFCPILALILVSTVGPLSAEPVLNEAGDLQQMLDNTIIPSEFSPDKYRLPTAGELTAFRHAFGYVLQGDLPAASDDAALANYDVVSYTDNVSGDVFTVLREKDSDRHWAAFTWWNPEEILEQILAPGVLATPPDSASHR